MATFSQTIILHGNPSANVLGTRGASGFSWSYGSAGGLGSGWRVDSASPTRYLDVFFDLSSIPDGATIQGLTLSVRADIVEFSAQWSEVGFTKNGSTRAGDNKAGPAAITSGATRVFGGSSDLWGTTWTVAELKAGTFRPYIQVEGTTPKTFTTVKIHTVTLAVEYATATTTSTTTTTTTAATTTTTVATTTTTQAATTTTARQSAGPRTILGSRRIGHHGGLSGN
jgi:hypothetical protein